MIVREPSAANENISPFCVFSRLCRQEKFPILVFRPHGSMTLRSRSGRHGTYAPPSRKRFGSLAGALLWRGGLKIACPEQGATTIASPSRPIGETFCPSAGWVGRNGTRGAGGIEWRGMFGRSERRKSTNKRHSTICFLQKNYLPLTLKNTIQKSPRRRSSRLLSQAAPPFCQ